MNFEWEENYESKQRDNSNIEEILDQHDKFSVDWDNFDAPNDEPSETSQSVSGVFNRSKKSEHSSVSRDFQNSRDVMDISGIDSQANLQRSFRYQVEDFGFQQESGQRYVRLKNMLENAKKNSLDEFYRNVDREKNAYVDERKFNNYSQFREHIKNLKKEKRKQQQQIANQLAANRAFPQNQKLPNVIQEKQERNFARKANQDYFQPQYYDGEQQFCNKLNHGEDFPDFIPDHHREEEPQNLHSGQEHFFNPNYNRGTEEKLPSEPKTIEEQKLQKILSNYHHMKINFEQLMGELKNTNEGQEKIVGQLVKMKQCKKEYQAEQNEHRRWKRQRKERQFEQKNKKLDDIKDQIYKLNTNEKDILYLKINEKIQHLEMVVRSALQQIHEEKQYRTRPRVINYFNSEERSKKVDFQKQFSVSQYPKEQMFSPERDTSRSRNVEPKEIDDSRQGVIDSRGVQSPMSDYFENSQLRPNRDYFSPLDMQLEQMQMWANSEEGIEQNFIPAQFGKEYLPREMLIQSKHLKSSLSHKNSVVYESFDFHVSSRFTVGENQANPIVACMRVGNKCSIDLLDVHVIVYGPQGPSIITDPSQLFLDRLKKTNSFTFQVYVNSNCLDENYFSIQISYKADNMLKKKISFRVPLPVLQLLRPQFVYEDKFCGDWGALTNQLYTSPRRLQFDQLRSHEDIKLYLPFIDLTESDPHKFSYGLVFQYPKLQNMFYLKMQCFLNGNACLQLRSQKPHHEKFKEYLLDVLNFIFFA